LEVAELMKEDAGRGMAPYMPTAADLAAQAAADRDQEQADRDYRELARLALAADAGACRCGTVKAPWLGCRVARWLAVGLLAPGPEKRPFPSTYLDWRHR
jgi:hypothetical protein